MARSKRTAEQSNHISGISTGATLLPDGSLRLAPMYYTEWAAHIDRESALVKLQESLNDYLAQGYAQLSKDRRRLWERLRDDHALDVEANEYTLTGSIGELRLITRPKAKEAASLPETPPE